MTTETIHQDSARTQVLLFWTQPSAANASIYSQKVCTVSLSNFTQSQPLS